MATNPDIYYLRSREDLLQYEDSRLNSLLNGLANFYTTRNDQSLWGNILRAIAIELARLEYDYAYDLVSKQPQFLTPADIRRRWADPLFVSRNYPSRAQFDLDFRTMLVDLLLAYKEGATTKAIHDVIFAYTGKDIIVEELYKEIGKFFDESDRNAITISVNVGGSDPLKDIQNLIQLQAITRDLYGAIDLTKPAHVGINFTTVFGSDENIDAFITGITDELRIFVSLVEDEPFDPMLIQAPIMDPLNPQTTIAAYGLKFKAVLTSGEYAALVEPTSFLENGTPVTIAAWQMNHSYAAGALVLDVNTGWNIFVATTAGTSGGSEPSGFLTTPLNGTLAEGPNTLVWTNLAPTAKAAYTFVTPNYVIKPTARNWIMLLVIGTQNASGILANYDPANPAGLLAPRLDRAWEIGGGDQAFIFELT
jgi:hypothetical protein